MLPTLKEVKQDNRELPINKNKDLVKVKWNPLFVNVTFLDDEGNKRTARLKEYFDLFKDRTKESKPKISSMYVFPVKENIICLLNHYDLRVRHNIFKLTNDVFYKDKHIDRFEYYEVEILDKAIKQGFKISENKLRQTLLRIGRDDKYNPVKEYMIKAYNYYCKSSSSNKKNIFKDLCNTVECKDSNKEKYIGRFILQSIYLACSEDETDIDPEFMLVFQGGQHIGKTTWFKNLLPKSMRATYFLGGRTLDLSNKDHVKETVSNWICEIGEIASTFRKSDQEQMKNFITSFKDKFRPPYAKDDIEQKRRVSLCGTTNDREFLRDLTGNRRYLVLNCKSFDKKADLDIDMLWGYFYSLYIKGVNYKFTLEEITELNEENKKYLSKNDKLLSIEESFILDPEPDTGEWLTSKQVFEGLEDDSLLSKFSIGRELKKTSVQFKRDKHKNIDLFYVKRLYYGKKEASSLSSVSFGFEEEKKV